MTLCGGSMDILWNHTLFEMLQHTCMCNLQTEQSSQTVSKKY